MRIAQVAPLAESVPPKLYGGTERVVSWLTEDLVRLGHDVTLFASADSLTSASLVPVWPRALRMSGPTRDPYAPYSVLLDKLVQRAANFDVIHCHTDWLHLPLLRCLQVPSLTTLHGRLDLGYVQTAMRNFPEARFVSISDKQRAPVPDANWLATVYHGLPTTALKPCYQPARHLVFLGRIAPEKGPETAIRLAQRSGRPLRIAAKIPRCENQYFKDRIEPMLDGTGVQFIGEIDDRTKGTFLGKAAALLFPIDWPEPFGLVMIEAMACGTPVIAMRRGSVPEIIEEGVTGFVVDNEEEALAAISRLGTIDRRRVRAEFEKRFAAHRMAQDYLQLYKRLAQGRFVTDQARASIPNSVVSYQRRVDHRSAGDALGRSTIRQSGLKRTKAKPAADETTTQESRTRSHLRPERTPRPFPGGSVPDLHTRVR
jgi:glycosyltransferase involved in cell wall biosynthesis